jgi:hypothetical protein
MKPDEDPARIGKTNEEKTIHHTDSIPNGYALFVALRPAIQKRILEKYSPQNNCIWFGC